MEDLEFEEKTNINYDIPRLRLFYGKNIDKMPYLLNGRNENGDIIDCQRDPISIEQLINDRIYCTNEHDRELLRSHDLDTGCAAIVNPDGGGETIICKYSDPDVRNIVNGIDQRSYLQHGSMDVIRDVYKELKKNAFVISAGEAQNLRDNKGFSEDGVREKLWEYLIGKDLIKDNLKLIEEKTGEKKTIKDCMAVCLNDKPGLSLLSVGSIEDHLSCISNHRELDNNKGCLVGSIPSPGGISYIPAKNDEDK